jgi:hypothetical protein
MMLFTHAFIDLPKKTERTLNRVTLPFTQPYLGYILILAILIRAAGENQWSENGKNDS